MADILNNAPQTAAEKMDKKYARIYDAIALKEPDCVPFCPSINTFPYRQNGFTVAQCVYDLDKAEEAVIKYAQTYDPDSVTGYANVNIGLGPILEKAGLKNYRWAGGPDKSVDDNSVQQFLEYVLLEDDEYDYFNRDRTGWLLSRCVPRAMGLAEPFTQPGLRVDIAPAPYLPLADYFGKPEMRKMMQTLWEIDDMAKARAARIAKIDQKLRDMGYPLLTCGQVSVPFDFYSDFLRGTIEGLSDLYARPEEVKQFCDEKMETVLATVKATGKRTTGRDRYVFMALHKGFDSFMGAQTYQEFYWSYLQRIICAIIDEGLTPFIFCEGSYNSRLGFLKDVPKGKVVYRFEKIDIEKAKRELGDVACISGGFQSTLLDYGTKQQVVDEVKRMIDICAPGGGFIFDLDCGLTDAKPENVEAMMETVRTYGKR